MNLCVRHFSGAFVLAPMGRVDNASSDPFLQALNEVVATCQKESRLLVLDFSAVEYISSIGLRALMIAARQMKTGGGISSWLAIQVKGAAVRRPLTPNRKVIF